VGEMPQLCGAALLSCSAGAMSAGGVQPTNPDPLRETTRYVKVADLSHGSFGFVQLARNTETQELVAIKFIERGDRVNRCAAVVVCGGCWISVRIVGYCAIGSCRQCPWGLAPGGTSIWPAHSSCVLTHSR
jgi:hypothetical protein